MSQTDFLKCPCQHCGGPIEFPPHGVGLTIDCPHCSQKTVLTKATATAAAPPTATPTRASVTDSSPVSTSNSRVPLLIVCVLVLIAGGGGAWWFFKKNSAPPPAPAKATVAGKMAALAATEATNGSVEPTPETADSPKSIDDLKPGPVALEKAKSGSLVYAVGTLKNESGHQRFGVKVEIELTDAKGRPAGKATDYTQVIEPRKEWRFRALVLDSKASAGKVVAIKEDN